MSFINTNLKHLRKGKGLTQEELAEKLGITRSSLGAYEEGRAEPRLSALSDIANFFSITVDALLNAPLHEGERPAHAVRVLTVTVDGEGKRNIEFVPVKAAAGYMSGYADPEYIEELPRFSLPMLPRGNYRAFEISGDSMLPLPSGTVVVCEYIENLHSLREGQLYVLLTMTEGVVFKRVFYADRKKGKLKLHSDNPAFQEYEIDGEELVEIWAAKAYIGTVFPEDGMSLQKLSGIVMDLQREISSIRGKSA